MRTEKQVEMTATLLRTGDAALSKIFQAGAVLRCPLSRIYRRSAAILSLKLEA